MDKKEKEYKKRRELLSAKLIEAREKAGLTQNDVAKTGLISQTELSKIENSDRKVEFLFLVDLAKIYNQPIDFFISEK
ncbi:MAG: helix-turn-helix transcriptional regulator [Candidatus Azobacteroides sp.]|nr:helix-turn-helix transcriptional regulator [Candidatus Azobacteroides sp.]